ncbi:hypothetical protein MHU86_11698 [Fragilaria crotonensis]|nr:hypothetical protein MHU86_11698 [Fragilaria crotonensis]
MGGVNPPIQIDAEDDEALDLEAAGRVGADPEARDGADADSQAPGFENDDLQVDGQDDDFIAALNAAIKAHEDATAATNKASAAYERVVHAKAVLAAAEANVTAIHGNAPDDSSKALLAAAKDAFDAASNEADECDKAAARAAKAAAEADEFAAQLAHPSADAYETTAVAASGTHPGTLADAGTAFASAVNEVPVNVAANAVDEAADTGVTDAKLAWLASLTAEDAVRSKKWQKFMKNQSDIGMLTIFFMHNKKNWLKTVWVRILLLLVLIAQVMLPIVLLLYAKDTYKLPNGCPMSADVIQLLVAIAIGCIYLVRITFSLKSKKRERYGSTQTFRWLRVALFLDGVMNTPYELFMYGINLFIVFVTPDPLNMVLNALAFEFILQLDDGVKKKYVSIVVEEEYSLSTHARFHDSIIAVYDKTFHLTRDATPRAYSADNVDDADNVGIVGIVGKVGKVLYRLYDVLYNMLNNILPVLIVLALIWLPWCKSGTSSPSPPPSF